MAIKIQPDYYKAYNNLGIAFAAQMKFNEAISCYREALKIEPNYTDAKINLENLLLLIKNNGQ